MNMTGSERKLRVGIIGLQHESHVGVFIHYLVKESKTAEFVAVAEEEARYLRDMEAYENVRQYADYQEMLEKEKPDAVFVDMINNRKSEAVCECLKRKIAVNINKPLCASFAQLENVVGMYEKTGGILTLQLNERKNKAYIEMKKAIEEGKVGVPIAIQASRPHTLFRPKTFKHGRPKWMFNGEQYGGVLMDLGIHDIDLVRWLSGAEVVAVTASEGNAKYCREYPEFTDYGMMLLKLTDGKVACLEVDWLNPVNSPAQCIFVIYGTEGRAAIEAGPQGPVFKIIRNDNEVIYAGGQSGNTMGLNAFDFFQSVIEGSACQPNAGDVLMDTLVALCAHRSAVQKKEIVMKDVDLYERIKALK